MERNRAANKLPSIGSYGPFAVDDRFGDGMLNDNFTR